jgi:hypothetical protein
MTAKEKAKELVDKYSFVEIQHYTSMFEVKECALIAVDEIIEELIEKDFANRFSYWQEVKQEIQQL